MTSDLEIARSIPLVPIVELAKRWGIDETDVVPYGRFKGKLAVKASDRFASRPNGKYVVVTAITPTSLGEGKTVTTIGTTLGLIKLGQRAIVCVRQPSMGPIFGIKGGAAGGGRSQILPMEDMNLHLTGDIHAVAIAHNLCAAFLDNHLYHGNALGIDQKSVALKRVVDLNDRSLRDIVIALGDGNGMTRQSGFNIAVSSEVMACLALADDLRDLRARLGRIVVGFTRDGAPITADDLKVAGSMAAVMRDAINPTMMQTTEGGLAFVHAGPFANIAHGNSSVIADRLALKLADYVVTEAGFGADMGCEKFFNIKCRQSGLVPDCAVLVATVRALKHHSGRFKAKDVKDAASPLFREDLDVLREGAENLRRQIANVRIHGVPVVVAINRFPTDHASEIDLVKQLALEFGADRAAVSEVFARGGEGGREVAQAVVELCEQPTSFEYLYSLDASVEDKIATLAKRIYGADNVVFELLARRALKTLPSMRADKLPICMAKTQYSLSDDPTKLGSPTGFTFKVRDIVPYMGAGFITPIAGDINLMPGLPAHPGGEGIDIDDQGNITGLF